MSVVPPNSIPMDTDGLNAPSSRVKRNSSFRIALKLLILVACVVASIAVYRWFQDASRTWESERNLKQIAQAIMKYEKEKRLLPPAYVADDRGRPLYSWRVVLLPYLGEQQLYSEFHLDEPWDGPHNQTLHYRMPKIYHSPHDLNQKFTSSSYVIPVDSRAAIVYPARPFHMVIDRFANTIMAFEIPDSTTPWTAPDTMTTEQIIKANAGRKNLAVTGEALPVQLNFDNAANINAGVTINGNDDFSQE